VSLLATIVLAACGGGGGGDPTEPPVEDFDRRSLLGSYTQRVVIPALRTFAIDAEALETAVRALAVAAADGSPATAEKQAAQSAWRTAMESWQAVEVMQVGPAGSANMVMGGLGLRDEIDSWPTINPCRVDQETVSGDYLDADFFSDELVNTRGLDAVEYILFDEGDDNACAAGVDINAEGTWDALVASGDLAARRAAYAAGAAADVAAHAAELRDAWEPTLGNFAGQLSNAGLSGSQFATAHDAVNDVFAALFYLELRVKDRKLAAPAGISPDCSDATCPELLESLWANASKEHILGNLRAAERTFLGGGDSSGVGFDDFLSALGASDLAATMLADLRAAIAATEAVPGTFAEALEDDPESVRGVHAALKLFTDNLKSQFVTVLNLEIPREGAGDND
jgi:predicted lipoprotein